MVLRTRRGAVTTVTAALALVAATLAVPVARAQTEGLFSVRRIEVDVTAESAAAAREAALAEAQRKALDKLLLRLAMPEDLARLPAPSDAEITQMVHDFEVREEHTSAVRYIGDLAFRFKAEPVRELLERNGIRFAGIASKPVLVLPVLATDGAARLWDEPNPWREAWAAEPPVGGLVPFVVPYGDIGDLSAVGAEEALAGDAEGFTPLAERYGTGDTLVAAARPAEAGGDEARLDLSATRYSNGVAQETFTDSVTGSASEPAELYRKGIDRLDELVQQAWKEKNLISFGAEQTLIATVPLAQLSDWVAVRERLDDIALVRDAEVLYLMRGEGRLQLDFVGDVTQLSRALAEQDLSLSPALDQTWVLRPGAPTSGPNIIETPAIGAPSGGAPSSVTAPAQTPTVN